MNKTDLIELAYVSRSSKETSLEQLNQLLTQSRTFNTQNDITGVLLYKDKAFLQVLEGPVALVLSLYQKIEQDSRHTCIKKLYEKPLQDRNFSGWAMMFHDLSNPAKDGIDSTKNSPSGFLPFDYDDNDLYDWVKPSTARILIESFRYQA